MLVTINLIPFERRHLFACMCIEQACRLNPALAWRWAEFHEHVRVPHSRIVVAESDEDGKLLGFLAYRQGDQFHVVNCAGNVGALAALRKWVEIAAKGREVVVAETAL